MKTKFYFLLAALLPFIAAAQEGISGNNKNLRIGINAGGTLTSITNEGADVADFDSGINFMVGASLEVPFAKQFSLLANINYERKSFNRDVIDDFDPDFDPIATSTSTIKYKARLQYITVPVDIRFYIDTKKKFFVNAGPYVAFYLDDTFKLGDDKLLEYEGDSNFKTAEFGVNMGIGGRFKMNDRSNLTIELRDNFGLTNINDYPEDSYHMNTNAFNLIVNWDFELKN